MAPSRARMDQVRTRSVVRAHDARVQTSMPSSSSLACRPATQILVRSSRFPHFRREHSASRRRRRAHRRQAPRPLRRARRTPRPPPPPRHPRPTATKDAAHSSEQQKWRTTAAERIQRTWRCAHECVRSANGKTHVHARANARTHVRTSVDLPMLPDDLTRSIWQHVWRASAAERIQRAWQRRVQHMQARGYAHVHVRFWHATAVEAQGRRYAHVHARFTAP